MSRTVTLPVAGRILPLDEVDRRYTLAALEQLGGHRRRTAAALGISVRTLELRLKRYAIEDEIREEMADAQGAR